MEGYNMDKYENHTDKRIRELGNRKNLSNGG